MFFTREDIEKIHQGLLRLGIKDSELPETINVNSDDTLAIVQDGKNKKINIEEFFNNISLFKKEGFINITDRFNKHSISLIEAIQTVPTHQRIDGLVITFEDINGDWRIYQFRGDAVDFFDENKWTDLYDYTNYIVKSITPDEEDLTVSKPDKNGNAIVSLKDRVYDESNFSGKGYKILRKNIQTIDGVRKNILTQNMINKPNTIYEIRYDFDLRSEEITIPEGCVLEFDGGSISNGNVILNDTIIVAPQRQIFYNIDLKGSCKGKFNLWWNGIDFSTSCTQAIQQAINIVQNSNATLYIPNGTYLLTVQEKDPSFSKNYSFHLYIKGCIRIEGESQEKTIFKRVYPDLTEITEEKYYTPDSNWGGLNTEYGSLIGIVVKESFNTFYDGIFEIANITLDGGMPWKHYVKNSPSVYGDKLINILNDGKKISKILVKNTSFKNASIEACYGQWGSYDNTTAIYEGCVFYNIGGSAGNTGGKYCKFYNCRFEYCRNAIEHTPSFSTGFGYFEVQECIFHNCLDLFSHNIQTNKTPASTMETWCVNKTVIFKNNMCVNDIEFVKEMYATFGATIRGFTISACNIAFITGNYFKNVANYANSGSLLFGDSSSSTGGTLIPAKCILITNNYIDSEERIQLVYSGSAKLVILNNNTISSLYGNARSITYGETSATVKTPNFIVLSGYETSPTTKYKNNEFLYNYIITDSHNDSNLQSINFIFPLNKKIHAYITMKNKGDTTGKVGISLLYNVDNWVTGVSKELVANAEDTSHLILPCSSDYSTNGKVCVGDFKIWNNIPVEITLRFILDEDVVDMDYMPMWSNTNLYYTTSRGINGIPTTIIPSSKGTYASRPTSRISVGYGYFATDKGVAGKGAMIYYTGDANTPWVYSDGTTVS